MAIYQVVCALLRADRTDEGEQLAVRMAERLAPRVRSDVPSLVSVTGALWLIAAVSAARRTDRGAAWERLDVAERLASMLGHDANHAWTAFGPTNVAIHRVSVAAELGDPGEALAAATAVDLGALPEGLTAGERKSSSTLRGRRRNGSETLRRLCICWKLNGQRQRLFGTTL